MVLPIWLASRRFKEGVEKMLIEKQEDLLMEMHSRKEDGEVDRKAVTKAHRPYPLGCM